MTQDLQFGLLLMVVGMGLVFTILAMLWGVIAIFQRIDRRLLASEEEKTQIAAATAARAEAGPPADLMAAIMVALDRYRQEEAAGGRVATRYPPVEIEQGQARWVAVGRAYQLRSNIVPRRSNTR